MTLEYNTFLTDKVNNKLLHLVFFPLINILNYQISLNIIKATKIEKLIKKLCAELFKKLSFFRHLFT
jgi:hypothetical protein